MNGKNVCRNLPTYRQDNSLHHVCFGNQICRHSKLGGERKQTAHTQIGHHDKLRGKKKITSIHFLECPSRHMARSYREYSFHDSPSKMASVQCLCQYHYQLKFLVTLNVISPSPPLSPSVSSAWHFLFENYSFHTLTSFYVSIIMILSFS